MQKVEALYQQNFNDNLFNNNFYNHKIMCENNLFIQISFYRSHSYHYEFVKDIFLKIHYYWFVEKNYVLRCVTIESNRNRSRSTDSFAAQLQTADYCNRISSMAFVKYLKLIDHGRFLIND